MLIYANLCICSISVSHMTYYLAIQIEVNGSNKSSQGLLRNNNVMNDFLTETIYSVTMATDGIAVIMTKKNGKII